MFYDKSLMNSKMLGNVWKLANDMKAEDVEESNLPKICNELDSWVGSNAVLPHRRLSLRASSNLIGGATKMYKQGLNRLFEDINKLDENITWRRKRGHFKNSDSSSNNDSSESFASPEQMRRQAITGTDSSISPKKRGRIESISVKRTPRYTMSRSRSSSDSMATGSRVNYNEPVDNLCANNNCDFNPENVDQYPSSNSDVTPEMVQNSPKSSDCIAKNVMQPKKTSVSQRIDKGVQTSPILFRGQRLEDNSRSQDGFDKELPFGYILIHDNYGSRIPSKIIFTSITSDVKSLH